MIFAPVAALAVTGDLPPSAESTARTSLLILAPAVALQFGAASLAAGLAAARRFSFAAAAYAGASTISLLCTVLFVESFGVLGAPAGLLAGAAVVASAHAAYARWFDVKISVSFRWLRVAGDRLIVIELLAAAALLIAQQINLAFALAALPGREGGDHGIHACLFPRLVATQRQLLCPRACGHASVDWTGCEQRRSGCRAAARNGCGILLSHSRPTTRLFPCIRRATPQRVTWLIHAP